MASQKMKKGIWLGGKKWPPHRVMSHSYKTNAPFLFKCHKPISEYFSKIFSALMGLYSPFFNLKNQKFVENCAFERAKTEKKLKFS